MGSFESRVACVLFAVRYMSVCVCAMCRLCLSACGVRRLRLLAIEMKFIIFSTYSNIGHKRNGFECLLKCCGLIHQPIHVGLVKHYIHISIAHIFATIFMPCQWHSIYFAAGDFIFSGKYKGIKTILFQFGYASGPGLRSRPADVCRTNGTLLVLF